MHCLQRLSLRYPQLLLPIKQGISQTNEYRNAVLRGKPVHRELAFSLSEQDRLITYYTPAGEVEALLLANRDDFVHAYRALAYRCESVDVLSSVGACIVSGLINWEKIRNHRMAWVEAGRADWSSEYKRFISDRNNYCDTLILLSSGPYSSVPAEWIGMDEGVWKQRSIQIRLYHELTHFICRKMMLDREDALRDEIYADCIGLIAALGEYNELLAKLFLGIENGTYREGGRLAHYANGDIENSVLIAQKWIQEASGRVCTIWNSARTTDWDGLSEKEKSGKVFDLLLKIN